MPPVLPRPTVWGAFFGRARLAWRLIREPQVPLWRKAIPLLALVYVLSPLDFIPDALPLIGELDDLMLLVLALECFVRVCPREPVLFHQAAIAEGRRFAPMHTDGAGGSPHGPAIDAEFRRE